MKSHKLGLALLAVALVAPLSACGNHGGASEQKLDADLTFVDPYLADTIVAQARKNVAGIRKASGNGTSITDYSSVYTGSLAPYSQSSKETASQELKIYDNRYMSQSISYEEIAAAYGAAKVTTKETMQHDEWTTAYTPKTAADTSNFATYTKDVIKLNDAVVMQQGQESTMTSTDADVQNAFEKSIVTDVFDDVISSLTVATSPEAKSGLFQQGSNYVVYKEASSASTLTNPAYPSDTTKAVGTIMKSASLITLSRDDKKGYFVSKSKDIQTGYVSRGFDEEAEYENPIVYMSQVTEITYSYDSLGEGTLPEKYEAVDSNFTPYLLAYSADGSVLGGHTSMMDVTEGYKKVNPSVTADYVYHTETSLISGGLYSFGYGEAAVAKDGFSTITETRFDTIKSVTGLDKFFAAEPGKYDIYAFVNKKGESDVTATYSVVFVTD
jgi:hypothetical protein